MDGNWEHRITILVGIIRNANTNDPHSEFTIVCLAEHSVPIRHVVIRNPCENDGKVLG